MGRRGSGGIWCARRGQQHMEALCQGHCHGGHAPERGLRSLCIHTWPESLCRQGCLEPIGSLWHPSVSVRVFAHTLPQRRLCGKVYQHTRITWATCGHPASSCGSLARWSHVPWIYLLLRLFRRRVWSYPKPSAQAGQVHGANQRGRSLPRSQSAQSALQTS